MARAAIAVLVLAPSLAPDIEGASGAAPACHRIDLKGLGDSFLVRPR